MSFWSLLADVLFVGHSLVGPNLPVMVQSGLVQMGVQTEVAAQVINGAPLRYGWDHSAEGEGVNARMELPKGDTRVLILTEAIPLASQVEWNDSVGYVARFAAEAWQARPDTQVYVYETWHSIKSAPGAKIEGDPGAGIAWRERLSNDLPLWESLTAKANAERPIGGPLVRLIPAGQAMGNLSDAIDAGQVPGIGSIAELFDDDIHPDGRALYFVALVHVAAITGENPAGLPAKLTRRWLSRDAVLTDVQARVFQSIAWTSVRDYQATEEARLGALAPDTRTAIPTELAASETIVVAAPPASPLPQAEGRFPGVTNPALSLGLAGVHDWSVQQPFIDVFKTARPWIGHLAGQWGGMEYDELIAKGALNAEGWPNSVPEGVTGLTTLFLTDLPADAGRVAGRYVLRYSGEARLELGGRAQNITFEPGKIEFDYTPGEGSVMLTVNRIDPANPLRGITVTRADRVAALDEGALFNPDWLARIRGVRGIRFMDWMATNNSTLARLEDRPLPGDFSWAINGVPVAVMVALANELQADPWFTLPHLADDELVLFYAEAVRDGLAPGLRAYVEYSNEVWNWQFAQATWADQQALARWGAKDAWVQFYALRAAEVMDIWRKVFGDQASARLVRVMSTQTGWLGLEDQILNAPLVLGEGRDAPARHFDAYAVTGYFAASLGTEAKAPLVRQWVSDSIALAVEQASSQGLSGAAAQDYVAAHQFDLATDRAATELDNGFVTGQSEDTLAQLLDVVLPHHAKVAADNGLRLIMYEGGTHVVGNGALVDDPALTAFYMHLNYTPQMGVLYDRLQAGWAKLTDTPFNAFVDVYSPNKWGSWGALRHLGDDNPRWQSLASGCHAC